MLNQLVPNLNLSIDSVTGKVKQQTEEIYNNIDAWRQQAVEQAAQEQKSSILKSQAEAQISIGTKKEQISEMEKALPGLRAKLRQNLYFQNQASLLYSFVLYK